MLSHLSASQLSALALGPSHTVLPSARRQVHQLRFPATSVSYSFGPSSTSLLGGVSQMKILSRTPPLGVPSGPPAVPSAPSGRLAGRAKAFSHPALPNPAGFPSIKPSCPVCAVISALNTCSFHVAWSLQLVPRACRTGKPPLTSLPVHHSPNLGEVPFFTPVSSRRIPKLFLSQCSSHCVIVVCFMLFVYSCLFHLGGSFSKPRSSFHFTSTKTGP